MAVFATRDLAVYASTIATLNGGWTLYHGIVRDRPRIVVRASRGEAVPVGAGRRDPLFMVSVSNRGRRPVNIEGVARLSKLIRGTSAYPVDFMEQVASKPRLEESQSKTFVHGQRGGYKHGDLATSRWYVTDGAGRVHPLRERYRQRLLAFVFWPVRRVLNWRDARARKHRDEQRDR